jgi:hypothetical protein
MSNCGLRNVKSLNDQEKIDRTAVSEKMSQENSSLKETQLSLAEDQFPILNNCALSSAPITSESLSTTITNYYLSPQGNDQWAGTLQCPWRSIKMGAERMRPGDSLFLRSGNYIENVQIQPKAGTSTKRIRMLPYQDSKPVVQASLRFVRPTFWTIQGLTLTTLASSTDESPPLQIYGGEGWNVRKNVISGGKGYADLSLAGAHTVAEPMNWIFEENCVHSNKGNHAQNQDHNVYINFGNLASGGLFR